MTPHDLLTKSAQCLFRALLLAAMTLFVTTTVLAGNRDTDRTLAITNGEWPPYMSETLPHFGIVSRIVRESFARHNITVNYTFYPWSRALTQAQTGQYDGSAVWVYSEEREADFYISDPVIRSQYVFFHRRDDDFSWESAEDLKGYRIGGTRNYYYSKWFAEAEADGTIKVERERSDEINLRKLAHGRIDLFPMDPVVAAEMISRLSQTDEMAKLTYHPKPLHTMSLRLLLTRTNPDNKEAMNSFNQGLRAIRDEGLVERYMNEYLIQRDAQIIMPITPME